MKALSFGEILWDVYPHEKYIGGAALNFAAHLALHGETVYMLSALGNDGLGQEAAERLKAWGIQSDFVPFLADRPTGRCQVTLDERSIPSYDLKRDTAYDCIPARSFGSEFDVLYFGTLALRGGENRASLKHVLETSEFGEVFVDLNIRPPFYSEETVRFALSQATIVKISDEELPTVLKLMGLPSEGDFRQSVQELAGRFGNLRTLILTRGGEGAYAWDCVSQKEYACEAVKTEVKSTVGAGDSFSAAFLHVYMKEKDIASSLAHASRVAAYVVSQTDAVPDYRPEMFFESL